MSLAIRYRMIDKLRGTEIVKRYHLLIHTPHTPESLRKLQRDRLINFLLSIRRANPYYSGLLRDIDELRIRREPEKVLQSLPPVDKPFLIKNRDRLFAPARHRKYQTKKTGGSTGEPLPYYMDLESVSESWAYILWCWHKYANYSPGNPYLIVAGNSLGSMGHRVKIKLYQFLQNNYFINGSMISKTMEINPKRIKNARFLYGYPSSIDYLLKTSPALFGQHSLTAVFTTSEQLTPTIRGFIEEQLGVPVYDMYGANDGGIISCECENHLGFHYDPLNCYVESFKNPDGQDELLLTGLNSLSLPFVRYRVGDSATLGDFGGCSCGNPFPMIRDLKGRTRDIVKLENGRAIHGSLFNKIFFDFPEIHRYRIIQHENRMITFLLEVDDFGTWSGSDRKSHLKNKIGNYLSDTKFEINELHHIPTGNQKFQLIESHVN